MEAQMKTQPLYVFPTREELKQQRQSDNAQYSGLDGDRRKFWRERHYLQEMWLAAQRFANDPANADRIQELPPLLQKLRGEKIPSYVNPVTLNKVVTEEEGAVLPSYRLDELEAQLDVVGLVDGSRNQRQEFWDLVELIAQAITPSDLLTLYDCEEQFRQEQLQLMGWEAYFNVSREVTFDVLSSEAAVALREILNGNRRQIQLYTDNQMMHLRQLAALYWQGTGNLSQLYQLVPSLSYRKTMGLTRVDSAEQSTAAAVHPLMYWARLGVRSVGDLGGIRARNYRRNYQLLPDNKPIPVGDEEVTDRYRLMQLFGLANGVWKSWLPQYKPHVELMAERLYAANRRRADNAKYRKQEPNFVPEVERHEVELFGQIVTQGSPRNREEFWLTMYKIDLGDTLPSQLNIWHGDNVFRRNGKVVQESAAHWIRAGFDAQWLVKPVLYGRAGVTTPAPREELRERGERLIEYISLRMALMYGLLMY